MVNKYGLIDGELILPIGGGEGEEEQFINTIPEEYRDKPWAKENSASSADFFKYVDNASVLVGEKGVIIPKEGADETAINKFHMDLGRPEKLEGYMFTSVEAMKDTQRNAEMDAAVQGILFKHGVSKVAGEGIVKDYEGILYDKQTEASKTAAAEEKTQDDAFAALNKTIFGDNKDAIIANAQKVLKETIPKEALPALDGLSAEALATVIAITHGVYKKFGQEDNFTGGVPGSGVSTETYEEVSAKQRELMKDPAYMDTMHKDHDKVMSDNKVLMDKMRAIDAKNQK